MIKKDIVYIRGEDNKAIKCELLETRLKEWYIKLPNGNKKYVKEVWFPKIKECEE